MLKLHITASTTVEEIEAAIPFVDMRKEAIERRDDAKGLEDSDEVVLELHEFGDVLVLFSPVFGYALVNEKTSGTGDSLLIDNGQADSAEHAAQQWIAA